MISALNSAVNERRRRGCFPMPSMMGHPLGAEPLMLDVRQRGLSRVGAADRGATPKALLTGSGRPPQFSVGAWGAQFSPNPAGAIFGSPRGFAAVTSLRFPVALVVELVGAAAGDAGQEVGPWQKLAPGGRVGAAAL